MADRLVAVNDADYRLPPPVRQGIAADVGDASTELGSALLEGFAARGTLPVNLLDYAAADATDQTANVQAAVDAVPTGGTLVVPAGAMFRVDGQINVARAMTISTPGAGGFYSGLTGTTAQRLIYITSGDVALRGLKIIGPQFAAQADQYGVYFTGGAAATPLQNVSVTGCDISKFAYAGIISFYAKRVKFDSNKVHDIGYAGIMLVSTVGGSVDDNDVWNITQATGFVNSYGITASRTPGSLVDQPRTANISISSNRVSDVPAWAGIDTHGGQALLISKNIITNAGTAISLVSAQNAAMAYVFAPLDMDVSGNLIDSGVTNGTRSAGVNLTGNATQRATGKITGNLVRGHGLQSAGSGAGIYLEYTLGVDVTANTVTEASPVGINAHSNNAGFTISGNTVVDQWSSSVNTKAVQVQVDGNTGYVGENTALANGKTATYTVANGFGVFVANQPNNAVAVGVNRMSAAVTPLFDPGAKVGVGFLGAAPAAKAAAPGTASGTDAAVINATVTALRNYGLVT
ncbi:MULTISPECIES: right-handed parallel beta-helix repeat-containing protein [unclassified Microbacterium]|uniref:right-handed parallel beta-helix repeat-containing protein n=1 Tax=unclassified Microbacterium TaxID=2609290 RepID=UPI00246897B2|nr:MULTISPECIES: right-handed parallel beta-helix repeat-containing protein [unclassified Microbacterium]MDH5134084.1 right-handed parallel beta-helix repeat-containing protein [Microbacterium sp. RD10]MDH5136812.1 right-handed parallel beta-helix repeat-containing protein [Microbacterium sp. RD11]MDH5146407.1 right-handed parallel beta-helix repeat-containing protein [Microbacterium sp. RD12]MDH5155141.1 right-handed parallel beta-helix repeat-containing protein [Microbacterium sp. RD06]MDH51